MGVLPAALILWIFRTVRGRLAKSGIRLNLDMGKAQDDRNRDTRWADGLRGIAAVGVVSSHICLSFWRQLITPTIGGVDTEDGRPMLLQRPFLRLVIQGQSFVALFFILTGFVNSLKPLRQAQNSQIEEALLSLARSALNRSARLVLPATAVTILAWLACQLHLNEIARNSNAYWLYTTSREASGSFSEAFAALESALIKTWEWGDNPYDQPQWALKLLLIGSFWTFLILLMTITTRPLFRISVLLAAYFYSWVGHDFILGTNLFFGILLAQIHVLLTCSSDPSTLKNRLSTSARYVPFFTLAMGLYMMSFPSEFAQDAGWSRQLLHMAEAVTPAGCDIPRFWASMGAQLVCLSIYFSDTLQSIITTPIPVYLGGVSFSLYLLHGPLMRGLLATMIFGPAAMRGEMVVAETIKKDEVEEEIRRYPLPSNLRLMFILPVFGVILMACVHAWAVKVEPCFARATKGLERFATGGGSNPNSPLQKAIDDQRKEKARS